MSRDGAEVKVTAQHEDEVMVAPSALKLAVFEMLHASARKDNVDLSGRTKFLKMDTSYRGGL